MKKIINFLKTLIFGRTSAWVDVEVSAAKRAEAPTIRIGWCIPKMEDLNTTLVNGEVTVAYLCDKNVINVTHIINGETVLESELTITSRIFTKVNNVLKKSDVEPITKAFWTKFEADLINAQGKGKKTYSYLRHPAKKA
jgi:hypothetical protein